MHISQNSRYTKYEIRVRFWLQKELCTISAASWTLYIQHDQLCAQKFLHALVWVLSKEFEFRFGLVNTELMK